MGRTLLSSGSSSGTSPPSDTATIASPGGVPERPKGTGCKPVGSAYGGSNPPAPIRWRAERSRFGGVDVLASAGAGLRELRAGHAGGFSALRELRCSSRGFSVLDVRGTESGFRSLLRSSGFHGRLGGGGSGGCAGADPSVSPATSGGDRAVRRDGREVRRRCRDGGVWCPDHARGRRGAGGQDRATHPRGNRGAERGRSEPLAPGQDRG